MAENILIVRRNGRIRFAALTGFHIVGARAVKFFRTFNRGLKPFAFLGDDVNQDRSVALFGELQILFELFDIVAVNGA